MLYLEALLDGNSHLGVEVRSPVAAGVEGEIEITIVGVKRVNFIIEETSEACLEVFRHHQHRLIPGVEFVSCV